MFKVLNKILGTCTICDFALQRSWFNRKDNDEEYKVYCPCGRSHKEWLEQEGLVDFIKNDMRTSSGEDLFHHVVKANGYGSLVHQGLMNYLSNLYEEEIKTAKKRKRVSVYHIIHLGITNCYTFYIKR